MERDAIVAGTILGRNTPDGSPRPETCAVASAQVNHSLGLAAVMAE